MKHTPLEWVIIVAIVLIILVLALAAYAGFILLVAWLIQLTAFGFGYTVPFWPLAGLVLLTSLFLGMLGRALRGNKS